MRRKNKEFQIVGIARMKVLGQEDAGDNRKPSSIWGRGEMEGSHPCRTC